MSLSTYSTCVGSICFSNTLKRDVCIELVASGVGSICFSNTLKRVFHKQQKAMSVGSICFSNTLKLPGIDTIRKIVWVVFVLAIPSNRAINSPMAPPCG